MKIEKTPFDELLVVHPTVISDARGYFFEIFNEARFRLESGQNVNFVQDNESMSSKGVLRGMHFQVPPHSQAKLVRVSSGSVLDMVVDLRRSKQTFGKTFSIVLSGENKIQLFIPEGFAHGFLVLEDHSVFSYKCSKYYSREHDRTMLWNDSELSIDWGIVNPIVSEKDQNALPFSACKEIFL
ncbi:MAG: dTDP-4-dehydrorhamnose 3,5-epimerase [Crocinitomicaceae bacterium]|nr:dTDP-4-dehydrorhamnose 3,5-epimerase [Crocinitomicaceae bacterium]